MTKHVLLIEDNALHLELMKHMLEDRGLTVTCVRSAEEGLLQAGPFDGVLCDISLPGGMGGLEFAETARKTRAFDGVPLIAISAAVLPSQQRAALLAGFVVFIEKPTDDTLAEKILGYLN